MRCHYREITRICGDYVEVDIFPVFRSPNGKRGKKNKPTKEAQKKLNQRNKERKLTWMLNTNFTPEDIEIHLTYRDGEQPEDFEAARKDARNFIRRCRRMYKVAGIELKYITVTEKGKNGRYHHHITISGGIDRDQLENAWGNGRANSRRLQFDENGLEALAKYIAKEATGKRGFVASQNLKKPEVKQSDWNVTHRAAVEMAENAEDRALFEKRYKNMYFVSCRPLLNEVNSGTYLHIKMIRKERAKR